MLVANIINIILFVLLFSNQGNPNLEWIMLCSWGVAFSHWHRSSSAVFHYRFVQTRKKCSSAIRGAMGPFIFFKDMLLSSNDSLTVRSLIKAISPNLCPSSPFICSSSVDFLRGRYKKAETFTPICLWIDFLQLSYAFLLSQSSPFSTSY